MRHRLLAVILFASLAVNALAAVRSARAPLSARLSQFSIALQPVLGDAGVRGWTASVFACVPSTDSREPLDCTTTPVTVTAGARTTAMNQLADWIVSQAAAARELNADSVP